MNLKTSSTLGYERRFNRALQDLQHGKDTFIHNLTADLPLHSPSFEVIIDINRQGPPDHDLPLEEMDPAEARRYLAGGAVILDVRDTADFAAGHLPGSIGVPYSSGQLPSQVSWLINPLEDMLLVADGPEQAQLAATELSSVRASGRLGCLKGGLAAWQALGGQINSTRALTAGQLQDELREQRVDLVLDVRELDEWQSGHLEGSKNMSYRQLSNRWPELDRSVHIAVICAGGFRSAMGTSVLERYGFTRVSNVSGGMGAWQKAGLPITRAAEANVATKN